MKTILTLAAALALVTPAAGSTCGWTGLALAPPDVEVQGLDVRLERPLQVVDVEPGSPAERSGIEPGMEILSLDREPWDESGFLPNLVRLQTVTAGETLRVLAAEGSSEKTFRVTADPCTPSQARQRARTLANLGRMQGALKDRHVAGARRRDESREAQEVYERARREHEAARRLLERHLSDPEVEERITESMAEAQRELEAAQEFRESQEWHTQMETAMREARGAMESAEVRHAIEHRLAEARRSDAEAQRALEAARAAAQDDARRRAIERAMRARGAAGAEEDRQAALEEALRRDGGAPGDRDADLALERAMAGVKESQEASRQALEELAAALPDEASRRQLRRAFEQAQEAMQGAEWQRQLEESLSQARESLESTRAAEVEMKLVQDQMRRALEEAAKGREARRRALLEASEAARFIRDAGVVFRGAMLQRVEPGIARHVGIDHGVLVTNLEPGSVLAQAGVEAGDVIVAVDGRAVEDVHDLFDQAAERVQETTRGKGDERLELELHTPDGRRTVDVPLAPAGDRVVGPL